MNIAKGAGNASFRNSGKNKFTVKPGIKGGIQLVAKGVTGPRWAADASVATINAAVQTWLFAQGIHNTYALRGQFIGPIIQIDDKSTAASYQTFGLGGQAKTDEGKYIFDLMYRDGGMSYAMALRSFDGQTDAFDYVSVAFNGQVGGKNVYAIDGQGNVSVIGFDAIPLQQLDFEKMTIAGKDKEASYKVVLSPQYVEDLNSDACIIETGDNTLIKRLSANTVTDVAITSMGPGAAGVYTVAITTFDGKTNLVTGQGALSWTLACFKCLRDSTGNVITITSIAIVGNSLTITVNTSDPDYLLGAKVRISLQSVSAVYAILGGYYEAPTIYMIDA